MQIFHLFTCESIFIMWSHGEMSITAHCVVSTFIHKLAISNITVRIPLIVITTWILDLWRSSHVNWRELGMIHSFTWGSVSIWSVTIWVLVIKIIINHVSVTKRAYTEQIRLLQIFSYYDFKEPAKYNDIFHTMQLSRAFKLLCYACWALIFCFEQLLNKM